MSLSVKTRKKINGKRTWQKKLGKRKSDTHRNLDSPKKTSVVMYQQKKRKYKSKTVIKNRKLTPQIREV